MNSLRIARSLQSTNHNIYISGSLKLPVLSSIFHRPENVSSRFFIKTQGYHSISSSGSWIKGLNNPRLMKKCQTSILRFSVPDTYSNQTRTFLSYLRKKKKTLEEHQKEDGVSPHYDLVYHGNSVWYIHLAFGSVQASVAAIFGALAGEASGLLVTNLFDEIMAAPIEVGTFILFSTLISIAIVQVSRQYPFRIYYSDLENQFIFVLSGLFFSKRNIVVRPGEIRPRQTGRAMNLLPWSPNMYKCSSQNILLFVESFKYPVYFNMLLGYQ